MLRGAPRPKSDEAAPSADQKAAQAETLRPVIDAVDALVVVIAADGSLWLWNRRCDGTSGTPLADVAGKPIWDAMGLRPGLRVRAQEAFDRLMAGEEHSVAFRSQWLRKDGRKARVTWTARLVAWADGTRFVIATGTETTRGRQVAMDIAETESRFETLLDVLPDPVIVHQNGRLVFANRAAVEMYGAGSPEELYGLSVIEFVAPDHRGFVMGRMARMLGAGEVVPMVEERHLRLDVSAFDVEVVASPVNFGGKPAITVVAREITARKGTEAALRASEARVRAVFDQSSLGMLLVDREARYVECNAAYSRLLGYDAGELSRLTVSDYTHPADVLPSKRRLEDLFAERNDGYVTEKRYIAKDGREIWARVHVSPIRDGSGPPRFAIGTVEDITERKLLEGQVRESSKMEALGRLAGGVAHDFNNVLTVVNGMAELLAESLEGDERAADAIAIRDAGRRAAELTNQLNSFGRRAKTMLQPVDLNGRIAEMVPMLRRLLGEDMDFTTRLDASVGHVEADPTQLDQVVMNLVVNGRDAMPGGGSLVLSTHALAAGTSARAGAGEGWARLEIADTGHGMAPDILEHIFEPFFTTKGKGKGTGLGLATVFRIVDEMGGYVWAESEIGTGSRFIVELPLCAERPAVTAEAASEPGPARRASGTILLVEDDLTVRELCKRALETEGYRVHVADPRDALDLAESLGSDLDILLTDVVMPDFDGPTIAAALRSRRRDLRVLFMSGYPRDREDELTGAAAQGEFLSKPFKPRELCDAVRAVLERPQAPA
jgi:two-component system, cell cycle sensor histidine kinase and response regulator CckA